MADRTLRTALCSIGTRSNLMRTASGAVLASLLVVSVPAHAQLAARRGPTLTAPSVVPRAIPGQVRSAAQVAGLDRQVSAQARAQEIRTYVNQARAAVVRSAPNGLNGLVVATGVTAENLAAGALQAARDSTGRRTWQGASLPVETVSGGNTLVTITQTDPRAILSWNRFDVGSQTTLQFDQKLGGVAQKDWVAVNRVVDPAASASLILGQIKADATVVVVNRNGVIFGNNSQVSANSLLASSLDIGNFLRAGNQTVPGSTTVQPGFFGTTTQERNIAFLQNGLLPASVSSQGATLAGSLTSSYLEGFFIPQLSSITAGFSPIADGDVIVDSGAKITAGKGGFVILTAPKITSGGTLSAEEGQVSLQAGKAISATPSTGAAGSADPDIRGLILRSPFGGAEGSVVNTGLIETRRGHSSLGASLAGSVTNSGLIAATTSVSRNGSIVLTAGNITLSGSSTASQASGLVITPDTNGETVPQGTASQPVNFKQSKIAIGGAYVDPLLALTNPLGDSGPAAVTIGQNSLIYAPNAIAEIGGDAGQVFAPSRFIGTNVAGAAAALQASKIDIATGAVIDVSGIKDITVAASRNSLLIDPVKRNELRDTPNYRETNTNGDFTLNGQAVYVDPRITGVRDDGVAYVGSPLIEAGSAASQIAVTASELMTKGGLLSLNVAVLETQTALADTPRIAIASGSTIDFSGGWVRYLDGIVRTSRLQTVDGRIVDIGIADPNDRFVGVGDGFTELQAKFGVSRTFGSSIFNGERFEFGYDEGRDAGTLIVSASTAGLDGALFGNAFAGVRQLSDARRSTSPSSIAGDLRQLQTSAGQMPSGGYLRIGAFDQGNGIELTGDIFVGNGAAPLGAIRLNDTALSAAGLSALSLRTSGGVSFASGSTVRLADGGALAIEAGRSVALDGTVTAPSGSITVRTIDFGKDVLTGVSLGSTGSPFRADDDIFANYSAVPDLAPFDITVGGTLSTAGLWVNDFTGTSAFAGQSFVDGGSISLIVAPRVLVGVGISTDELTLGQPVTAADLSGSILIASAARLDVSSGGYVGTDGVLDFRARGGDLSLINATNYAANSLTDPTTSNDGRAGFGLGGANQSVTFTPYRVGQTRVVPSLIPEVVRAQVAFDTASIKGFGFDGGGTFTLVAPDIAMGSAPGAKGPRIGLDFLQRTGFATLDLSAFKARFVSGLFNNGNSGVSAFLDTERFVVGAGQTFDLTQTVLPSLLDTATLSALTSLASGANVQSILTPQIPVDAFDRKAAHLKLGGVTELEVSAGGTITGAAQASIVAPRLFSAGTIRMAGGSIMQVDTFEALFSQDRVLGVRDAAFGGGGLSDVLGGGTPGQSSGFDENAPANALVFSNSQQTQRLTNAGLFSFVDPLGSGIGRDVSLVFTGRVALNDGIRFAPGSVTDLSGTALYDPRAPFLASGNLQRSGVMIAGGSIATDRFGSALAQDGYSSAINPSSKLVAEAGASINLDGASGVFDQRLSQELGFQGVTQWSNGGSLIVGNGALLTGATVSARGGDDGDADLTRTRATGGTLDWVSPVIRQSDTGAINDGSALFAAQVMNAGFVSLVARNGFTAEGTVTLNLAKSFIVTTDTVDGQNTSGNLVINAGAGANAVINAPYIRLASRNRTIGGQGVATAAGSLALSAQTIDIVGAVEFNVSPTNNPAQRGSVSLSATGDIRLTGTQGLIDTATGLLQPGLSGQLASNGDLLLKAGQVYATTGTGNLQALIEYGGLQRLLDDIREAGGFEALVNRRRAAGLTPPPALSPFLIASSNQNGLVRFDGQGGALPTTPYSAGSYLKVAAANIEQNGVVRAPLGLLEIGSNTTSALNNRVSAPATRSLRFGADSLTSVTARTSATGTDALSIPYGTTTDLIEYFFTPGTNQVLTTMPSGELRFAGADIVIASDAGETRVDGRGGGDVFAFEFIPGTGGSRDVLDRFNPDAFSGNAGLQFPDGRQVYAILPANSATAALFDPVYSADYAGGGGVDIYGSNAGLSVRLDAAPGIAAGDYLLLPAHYALLPGALRLVENVGSDAPLIGGAATLLDGSVIVGGSYATAGTSLAESLRRSFTVQSSTVFSKYSRIETTSGSASIIKQSAQQNVAPPALPRDAARVVLSPLTSLKVAGAFATDAAAGGLGAQVDVGGTKIRIANVGAVTEDDTADHVLLTTDTLANFNANSLSIGAIRTNNRDGTTSLGVVAQELRIDNDVRLTAPEILLVVGGRQSLLRVEASPRDPLTFRSPAGSGALITATGTLSDQRTGDYVIKAIARPGDSTGQIDDTGVGAIIRVSSGPSREVARTGEFAVANSLVPARLEIGGGAAISGASIAIDSSRGFAIDRTVLVGPTVTGNPFDLVVSGDSLRIGSLTFAPELEARFAMARNLTYRSPDVLNFFGGNYVYNNLTIDAAGIGLDQPLAPTALITDIGISADHLVLRNSGSDRGTCADGLARLCAALSTLTIDARDVSFGSGAFRTYGFDGGLSGTGITITAREGIYISGEGRFSAVNRDENLETPINLITPFIADRSDVDVTRANYVRPDYVFETVGPLTILANGLTATPAAGTEAPGARIAFNAGNAFNAIQSDITITDTLVRATAGTVDVSTTGSLLLKGSASLQAPGFTKTFDDGIEKTVVSASGGAVNLVSKGSGTIIDAEATTSLVVDNGIGKAGTLNIAVSQGEANILSSINPGIALTTARTASFLLDVGQSAFDLAAFVAANGKRFQGNIVVHSGTGDLSLAAGQTIRAASVSLTADGGIVSVAGKIDTSGESVAGLVLSSDAYKDARVDGGAISLFGRNGVTLASSAELVSTTSGYGAGDGRQAKGGLVSIGVGLPEARNVDAPITIASGATINVAALRSGDRLISEVITDPLTRLESRVFRLAPGDLGGVLAFRAPLLAGNTVNLENGATVSGARELSVEAYRRYDLDQLAAQGAFSGIALRQGFPADVLTLDPAQVVAGKANFLSDLAPGTLPDFIQNFSVSGPDGSALTGYRLRPGVELASTGVVRLTNAWNLGAGEIVNADGSRGFADALAAGLLVASPLGLTTSGPLAGQQLYEVVAGKEAELFEHYVGMLYRVGGSVRGEAPVVTLRAGSTLDIRNSIGDGFFSFHDLTNPEYINYQLGGGDRLYRPVLNLVCGAADNASCADSILFSEAPRTPIAGELATRLTVFIGAALQGDETTPFYLSSPYNPLANAASPTGTGDPFGVAELFPLLSDGSAVRSSDLNLVAGALGTSANPLQLDISQSGSVVISGEKSYEIKASRATARLAGALQLGFGLPLAERRFIDFDELLELIDSGDEPEFNADFYAVINWGGSTEGAVAAARDAAQNFAAFTENGHFLGPVSRPTGVSARLRDVIAFFAESGFAENFAQGVEQNLPGYRTTPALREPTVRLQSDTSFVGTVVRTGDGSIDVAASADIDLRRTVGALTRRDPGADVGVQSLAQVGGTALYTAGVRAAAGNLSGGALPAFAGYAIPSIPGPGSGVSLAPVFSRNGGSITLNAGRDILGRRDAFNELFGQNGSAIAGLVASPILDARGYPQSTSLTATSFAAFGNNSGDQRWRYGSSTLTNTQASISYNFFTSGVGALAGGDVSVNAGRDLSDVTIALTNSLVTGVAGGLQTLVPLGSGDLLVNVGRDMTGGQFDIALGTGRAAVGGDVLNAAIARPEGTFVSDSRNLLRVRVADATFDLSAKGEVIIGGLGALGLGFSPSGLPTAEFFSSLAGVRAQAAGDITYIGNRPEQFVSDDARTRRSSVLPPSLSLVALNGDISFGSVGDLTLPKLLAPSRDGQLSLLAGGNIANLGLAMSDAAPVNFFGAPDLLTATFPTVTSTTSDADLRILHNRNITHLGDTQPVRIAADGSINDIVLSLPKQARIRAGGDIVDLFFQGQNVSASDVTRISAGGDIFGSIGVSRDGITQGRSAVLGNNITVGGPGALFVEAGRNLGPFITSATGGARSEAGGIRTIGNEANPWLGSGGADLLVLFGVSGGTDYAALERVYLNPANLAQLDGDLFEQNTDALGTKTPDRTRYSYAPVLAEWLRVNQPALFASVFGATPPTGDALKAASYARYEDLYEAFAGIDQLSRNRFLIEELYFGELAEPSDPDSESFNQFIRSYRAVQTLFPASNGYTDNLATYTTDPSTVNADRPLGVPVKKLVNGQPAVATTIETGNVDLRLATFETTRGGNITILGPGGNFVAGSVVRTDAQVRRRITAFNVNSEILPRDLVSGNFAAIPENRGQITSIPAGFEGVLTLRGGEIRGFTDGSFVLNQSRLFTQAGGDITLFSANGDLNAGQGPRSSSSFPPIVLRFSPNGSSEVDSAGSVSGAGIGAFKSAPSDPESAVKLIAPVGTVDAGDAGVRASGSLFVAAARVANSEGFSAGGTISGVPSLTATAAPPAPASAASAIAANAFKASDGANSGAQRASRIFVDVLGYFGGDPCPAGTKPSADGQCEPQ